MEIWRVPKKTGKAFVAKIVHGLEKGKVFVLPTDTVYGLVADAANSEAVEKVFQIKGREPGKPLPIFVEDIAMAKELADIKEKEERFLQKVWPGKVTVVLPSNNILPQATGTARTIGLRIPSYDLILSILRIFPRPLTGTSANLAGTPSLRDSKDVVAQFKKREHRPDIVIDAGKLPLSLPSTVIDWTGGKQKVLRQGAL
ncbi:MAG: threonylcarbamoyl-AMP synthase [Candidatus Wildermuthbacteria bacterium]|nr:threonylcarbamoyl-AMP synthase [Candidatus Wildermuthbacteria bacterium]